MGQPLDLTDHHKKLRRNLILLDKAKELIREFKRGEIDFLLLKGLFLAFSIYPDAGIRSMVDIDFLIRREDLNKIEEIILRLGYSEISPKDQRNYGCDVTFCNKERVFIDIHWDLCQYERFKGIINITEDFWERAVEFNLDEIPINTLSFQDHILYVSLHYALIDLLKGEKGAFDLFFLISGRPLNWKLIIDNTYKYGLNLPLFYSLSKASKSTNLALPKFVLEDLKPPKFKKRIVDYLLQNHKDTILRYLSQAMMVASYRKTFLVLCKGLKGIRRLYKRRSATALKNISDATR